MLCPPPITPPGAPQASAGNPSNPPNTPPPTATSTGCPVLPGKPLVVRKMVHDMISVQHIMNQFSDDQEFTGEVGLISYHCCCCA